MRRKLLCFLITLIFSLAIFNVIWIGGWTNTYDPQNQDPKHAVSGKQVDSRKAHVPTVSKGDSQYCSIVISGRQNYNILVNGEYISSGIHQGRPYYEKRSLNRVIYIFYGPENLSWYIGDNLGSLMSIYAIGAENAAAPDLITRPWRVFNGQEFEVDDNVRCICSDGSITGNAFQTQDDSKQHELVCPNWASQGHCIDNPTFMCINCQKSCGDQCRKSVARLLSIEEQGQRSTWMIEMFTITALKVRVSIFRDIVKLSPTFDVDQAFSVVSHLDIFDGNFPFWSIANAGKTLVLNARDYIFNGIRFQRFTLDFGPKYFPFDIFFAFDVLDFQFDKNLWTGFMGVGQVVTTKSQCGLNSETTISHVKYANQCILHRREVNEDFVREAQMLEKLWNNSSIIDMYAWTIDHDPQPDCVGVMITEKLSGTADQLILGIHNHQNTGTQSWVQGVQSTTLHERTSRAIRALINAFLALKEHNLTSLDLAMNYLGYVTNQEGGGAGGQGTSLHVWKLSKFKLGSFFDENNELQQYYKNHNTLSYAAPEQLQIHLKQLGEMEDVKDSGNSYDARAMLYSIGLIAYEMLTGQLPFSSKEQISQGKITELYKSMEEIGDFENCPNCFKSGKFDISETARHFCSELLRFLPSQRMSLEAALEHEFLNI